ncbi:SLC13 family permease [Sulfurovum sp. ST-21]|uniref:SLC13/DASS family transporter n=1 Tax=Sulfurovum indicum TaxID=2779528 RepID=A0A7M1S3A7_9BACT|nr:DASS family sodium-coupled anion symporter [Sulfurovum indicum]QOR61532.1 SLC13/DASS family transporter [Sulfurovum indicum]
MKKILAGIGAGVLFFALSLPFFTIPHAMTIAIVALLVTLWTNEALPLGVVSLLPIILFPVFGILDTNAVAANYSKSIIFLFLGGFMLAIAIEKIELHKYFSAKLLSFFPKTARGIIYALAVTSALLSAILSNTTITLMLMPIALFLSENIRLKVRFLLATAYGASIGGILTPIGTAPNLILLGFLEEHRLPIMTFGGWMLLMLPIVGLMLLIMPYILSLGVSSECVEDVKHEAARLNSEQKRLYGIIGLLAFVLVANTFMKQITGVALNEKLVLLGFGLLMFVPKIGFLTWDDTRNLPYEIIFLFGAGFSIAAAFISTGLAEEIAQKLHAVSSLPLLGMFIVVALFVTFSTEITSNTALTSIAIPIFYEFSKYMPETQSAMILMVATVAASYAFMLPIATPPNAIVMSSRIISIKEMAMVGLKLNFIGVAVLSLVAYFIWRLML